jgi:hypothetical protein
MNPLNWKREHQIAWIVICLGGAIVGLLAAWFQSPFYQLCHDSISGEWANCTRVRSVWGAAVVLALRWRDVRRCYARRAIVPPPVVSPTPLGQSQLVYR